MHLELPDSRTEVIAFREGLQSRTRRIDTLKRQVVATPADLDTLLLQGKEYDQGGECNCA